MEDKIIIYIVDALCLRTCQDCKGLNYLQHSHNYAFSLSLPKRETVWQRFQNYFWFKTFQTKIKIKLI